MNQFRELLGSLSLSAKISIVAAILVVGTGLYFFVHQKKQEDYKVLYTRLAPEDTAAIAAKLKETQVEYRSSDDGTSILVPSSALASSRLTLASAGLPKSGRIGYELFDKTNLTATDFAEHVNFARALEGELERTILLIEEVEKTRVHLTFPKESVFVETRQPAKASVVVGTRGGQNLSMANVTAIRNLVASAVQGLAAESVAVVDMRGQLLGKPRANGMTPDGTPNDEFTEYRTGIERDMTQKLTQALAPVLGEGKFRAGVTVDCDYASREESEEALDPERTIKVTENRSEENANSSSTGGVPGTASNLPGSTGRFSGGGGATRKTENSTYAPTRSVKLVKTPRGQVKRVSVAIVVDQDLQFSGKGAKRTASLVPPSPEKLKVIKDVASSILGIQADRGDQITVESLAFDTTIAQMRQPAQEPMTEATNPLVPKFLQPVVQTNPGIIWQSVALVVLLVMSIAGFTMWRKSEKARKVQRALEPAAKVEAAVEAATALEPGEERLALDAVPHEQLETGLANLQEIADMLRERISQDPKIAALAIRHMLAQHE